MEFSCHRKTGKQVQQVARDSDEFEPFEAVMSQADRITPKGKPRRKSSGKRRLQTLQEDDGSMDMEVDDEGETSLFLPCSCTYQLQNSSLIP